ncbi:DUF6398 domain-containing protein [Nitrosomonas communis]
MDDQIIIYSFKRRDLCRHMETKLCRKAPSPITPVKLTRESIVFAYPVGLISFLFDKSKTPYTRPDKLCQYFDLSPKTGLVKSTAILALFKCGHTDPD